MHLESNWLSPIKERNITIVGSKKMLVYEDLKLENKLTVYEKNVEVVSGENITDENYLVKTNEFGTYSPYIKPEDALYNSIEHFRTSIINQTQSLSNPSQAIRVHKILEIADNNMNM
ncbi:hypothetical protein N5T57_07830 [Aliarcobacter cryaerophilus]|uniref:hypothetical protein n=1 Tax=Aliarcobacter cryaerophilus TaxID=28198 RepID=UPI0021B198C1|nr:hypothetical protein [Aliarcobacter cryaerophilus]MCT7522832.1 hypothetical protein [Aliarcobacter cryaerophilus]